MSPTNIPSQFISDAWLRRKRKRLTEIKPNENSSLFYAQSPSRHEHVFVDDYVWEKCNKTNDWSFILLGMRIGRLIVIGLSPSKNTTKRTLIITRQIVLTDRLIGLNKWPAEFALVVDIFEKDQRNKFTSFRLDQSQSDEINVRWAFIFISTHSMKRNEFIYDRSWMTSQEDLRSEIMWVLKIKRKNTQHSLKLYNIKYIFSSSLYTVLFTCPHLRCLEQLSSSLPCNKHSWINKFDCAVQTREREEGKSTSSHHCGPPTVFGGVWSRTCSIREMFHFNLHAN